jgi:hypothetical protein
MKNLYFLVKKATPEGVASLTMGTRSVTLRNEKITTFNR